MCRIRGFTLAAGLVFALVFPTQASAAIIRPALTGDPTLMSFGGTFQSDNDVALFLFSLTADSTVMASTSSAASGGFDTYLALFQADTLGVFNLVTDNDDSAFGVPDAALLDPFTGLPGLLLHAGTYTLALTQSPNFANLTLAAGFSFDDTPMFTCDPSVTGVQNPGCEGFVDVFTQEQRTATFAGSLAIIPVAPPAPVPEPGTLALLAVGLGCVVIRRSRVRG